MHTNSEKKKKKGDCAELETQIKTLQFGAGLAQELQKFQVRFESAPQVRHLMFDILLFAFNVSFCNFFFVW